MLKINKKVEYALMALKYMASKPIGELSSAREICEQFSIPFDTTSKVMQLMNNKNILQAKQGIKGGYVLARPLSEVTFMELSKVIEKKSFQSSCETSKGMCELYGSCNIIDPVSQLGNKINQFLEELTLEDLLFNNKRIQITQSLSVI